MNGGLFYQMSESLGSQWEASRLSDPPEIHVKGPQTWMQIVSVPSCTVELGSRD